MLSQNTNNHCYSFSDAEAGDFEEVLSKKAKRQRLQQIEEQRKKMLREKERQDKLLAKRNKTQKRFLKKGLYFFRSFMLFKNKKNFKKYIFF